MKIRISLLTIFFWSVTLASEAEDADIDPPVVTTQQGKLQGLALQSRAGRKYYGFLGVSYGSSKIRFEVNLCFQLFSFYNSKVFLRDHVSSSGFLCN